MTNNRNINMGSGNYNERIEGNYIQGDYYAKQQKRWLIILTSAMVVYIWIGLQFYISLGVLIPFLLPSAVFWNYIRLALRDSSLINSR